MGDDRVQRAFARLSALQQTVSDLKPLHGISEIYVQEYHDALGHLEAIGFDTQEFLIPDSWLRQQVIAAAIFDGGESRTEYTKERYVQEGLFLLKLRSVLAYFQLAMEKPKQQIGFHGRRKQS